MNRFLVSPMPLAKQTCVAIFVTLLISTELVMSQVQPRAEPSSLPPPPLVDKDAVRAYYHDALFNGRHGLPALDDVAEIKAELTESPSTRRGPISSFTVPPEFHARLLELFEGASIDSRPNFILWEVGTLVIRTKDKRLRRVCWYGGQKSRLIFSLHGVRCIGAHKGEDYFDEANTVQEIVRDAYDASKAGQKKEDSTQKKAQKKGTF
jgi:hypothetical protein